MIANAIVAFETINLANPFTTVFMKHHLSELFKYYNTNKLIKQETCLSIFHYERFAPFANFLILDLHLLR